MIADCSMQNRLRKLCPFNTCSILTTGVERKVVTS